ncbi:hypothetical protein P355_4690 [Burkholderia cenocepacia KC-01]|nr:hypothetical protein P355_4690 [Burkholderia cenocepacia KC-01]
MSCFVCWRAAQCSNARRRLGSWRSAQLRSDVCAAAGV